MDLVVIAEASLTPLKMLNPVLAGILNIWSKVVLHLSIRKIIHKCTWHA